MAHSVQKISPRSWFAVAITALLLFVAFAFLREYVRNRDIATELERMEAENSALNAERLASLELISQLSTETAVEAEARAKLNLAKEGEDMYVFVDEAPDPSLRSEISAPQTSFADDPGLSNPAKWFYYFFVPSEDDARSL